MGTGRQGDGPPGAGSRVPRSGDVLHVTREASVQFASPILFRVIRVHDWPTYNGWVWLDGYQLNAAGDAVERRSIFVQTDGLRTVSAPPWVRPARAGGNGAATPGPAPRQPDGAAGPPPDSRPADRT